MRDEIGESEPAVAVFVTNQAPDHSYTSAARYGALRPVTRGNIAVFKTERLREEIIDALVYSSKDDYLLFSGSSFIAGLCLAVWMILHRECKALLYDRSAKAYVPRIIKRETLVADIERARDKLSA